MRLGYLCHFRSETVRGKGDNGKKEHFISTPSLGKVPLKPAFVGQLGAFIPLETVCVSVWMLGQLRKGKQADRKPPAPSTACRRMSAGEDRSSGSRRDPTLSSFSYPERASSRGAFSLSGLHLSWSFKPLMASTLAHVCIRLCPSCESLCV